jgi:DNA-binding MarR family transcriptional regulator
MTREDLERMADAIVRLRMEILRRRAPEGELQAAELTTPQALALRTIVREGPLRMGVLAEALGVSVATASRTVDALEGQGLARREADPADARAVRVAATARGRREHEVRRERFVEALERFMEELAESERRELADALETVNRLLPSPARARVAAEEREAASGRRRAG